MLVISCHADTGFEHHRLRRLEDGRLLGHLDNFAGVKAVMQAYFSGELDHEHVRIELTHGEETDFAGALEARARLAPHDAVLVVDVTGTPTEREFVIEKCVSGRFREFLEWSLAGLAYDIYAGCPDPVADEDEVDVYLEAVEDVCMLAVPVAGGDYNEGPVTCREASLAAIAEAIIRIAAAYPDYCRRQGRPVR